MQKNLLIIFIKEPKLGFVKTRIAKNTSDDFALDLYINMTKKIIHKLKNTNYDLKLCVNGNLNNTKKVFGDFNNFKQVHGTLGDKMKNAFITQFDIYEKITLIGSDIPQINTKIINESFLSLDKYDMTIGASYDGGYYLISFNKKTFNENVFDGIVYSTNKVLEQTLQKANTNVFQHIKLHDVDTIEDIKYYDSKNIYA